MSEFFVDSNGVKFVPENKVTSQQIEVIKSVFEEYLSSKLCEEAISNFVRIYSNKMGEDEPAPKKWVKGGDPEYISNKPYQISNSCKKPIYIGEVTKQGKLKYKSGRTAIFTIQDIIFIKDNAPAGMTYKDFNEFCENLPHLSRMTIGKIFYNISIGMFEKWINHWKEINTPKLTTRKTIPIQNNPEKRKELGYGGIP